MSRTYAYFAALVGVVCVGFLVRLFFFTDTRTVRADLLQGALIGFGLAFVTAQVIARVKATKANGWVTMRGLGEPSNGVFTRAAHAQLFPGPVNVPQEALYWWANTDAVGRTLNGANNYILHFPADGLPSNDGFWSLTVGDARNRFVPNPINRYAVSDHSGLVPNADGSRDVHLQTTAPVGGDANWLPTPTGAFILWFRVYLPDAALVSGAYAVPPVRQASHG